VSFRYIIFGISIAQKMHPNMRTWQRVVYGIFNTDEIYVVAMKNEQKLEAPYLFGLMTLPFVGFVAGTACGALFTNFLPASLRTALAILIFGMFIAIIVPEAKKSFAAFSVILIAIALSYILKEIPAVNYHLSAGQVKIICAIVSAGIGAIFFPLKSSIEKEEA